MAISRVEFTAGDVLVVVKHITMRRAPFPPSNLIFVKIFAARRRKKIPDFDDRIGSG